MKRYKSICATATLFAAAVVATGCVAGAPTAAPSDVPGGSTSAASEAPSATMPAASVAFTPAPSPTTTPMPDNVIVVPDLSPEGSGAGVGEGNAMYVPGDSERVSKELSAGMVVQVVGQTENGHWLLVTVLETKPVGPLEPSQLQVGQTGWVIPYWVGLPTPLLPAQYPVLDEMPSPDETGFLFQYFANTRIDAALATLEATGAQGDLVYTALAIVQLTFTPQP